MGLSKTITDWRQLKRELISAAPRPRNNDTFRHSDIFGSNNSKEEQMLNYPSNLHTVGKVKVLTPSRVRQNNNNKSTVLDHSDIKKDQPTKNSGLKTYEVKKSLFKAEEKIERKQKINKNNAKDHKDDWFYQISDEPRRDLKKSQIKDFSNNSSPFKMKSPSLMKQEELYLTEISKCGLISESQDLSLVPRRKSQFSSPYKEISRKLTPDLTSSQMRLSHNNSNIFYDSQYDHSKFQTPQKQNKLNDDLGNVQSNPVPIQFNEDEINNIKKQNHNFSDVFGLEYGTRSAQKPIRKQLSNLLDWTNNDSIKYRNDLPLEKKLHKSNQQSQRSRMMDQKSILDNHQLYDTHQKQKQIKLQQNKSTILRDIKKHQKKK